MSEEGEKAREVTCFDALWCFVLQNTETTLPERDTIFAIAQLAFNNEDKVHNKLLQTIYMKLTGTVDFVALL